jgi:hypothetical protein
MAVYRAFLNIEITDNEGWNAYFADAAMGEGGFYKSAPVFRPKNVPDNFILVKVYQYGDFLGYIYLDKNVVEGLHGRK